MCQHPTRTSQCFTLIKQSDSVRSSSELAVPMHRERARGHCLLTSCRHAPIHRPPRGIQVARAQLKRQSMEPYAQPSELRLLPKVTHLTCRRPLLTLPCGPEAAHLGDLMRPWVGTRVRVSLSFSFYSRTMGSMHAGHLKRQLLRGCSHACRGLGLWERLLTSSDYSAGNSSSRTS